MHTSELKIPGGLSLRQRAVKAARRGLTLIEAAMVLAILALVVAGIMLFYTSANTSRLTTAALGDLAAVQQSVRSLYGGQPSYNGLSTASLAASKALPSRMTVSTTGLRHSFNGTITVASADGGAGADSGFSVQFNSIPQEACIKMLSADLGRGLFSAGASTTKTQTAGLPFTPGEATASCTNANNNITWIFN